MRRVDILTYWGVPNYGAWTQAYALNHVIRAIVGNNIDVRHIDYLEQSHYDLYYKTDERLYNSFQYSWNDIPHTRHYTEQEIEQEAFDILITGADSIWTLINVPGNSDFHLIGYKLNARKLMAYAASAGATHYKDMNAEEAYAGLKNYASISVRDENTFCMVDRLIGVKPQIVLDPALLWDFQNDSYISKPSYKDYIAVYGVHWEPEFIQKSIELAREKNLKLISIGYVNDWCDMSLRMIELRGKEWVGMFSQASYVITSTFHGLMLGLSYNKQIKFCQVGFVKNRSQTLLNELGIPDFRENYTSELDYSSISAKLAILREQSLKFLRKEIGEQSYE